MPVDRCPLCHRGRAGYLDGEKTLSDLTPEEIRTEIRKYAAKEARIRAYVDGLRNGDAPLAFPNSRTCPECGHGWREFQEHRKDLEQLTATEAKAALANNRRWLGDLRQH